MLMDKKQKLNERIDALATQMAQLKSQPERIKKQKAQLK